MIYRNYVKHRFRLTRLLGSFILASTAQEGNAAMQDPVPLGYGMGNMGTIIVGNAHTGRQSWLPAGHYNDSLTLGISAMGHTYYDRMDNLREEKIWQAGIGGFYADHRITAKAAYVHYDALGLYREQAMWLSLGTRAFFPLIPSVDIQSNFLSSGESGPHDVTTLGLTMVSYWRFIAAALSVSNLAGWGRKEGGHPKARGTAGLYTRYHRLGAQGMSVMFRFHNRPELKLRIGEEYKVNRYLTLSAGFSSRPLMVSFGFTFHLLPMTTGIAFSAHPQLGWCKGMAADWAY